MKILIASAIVALFTITTVQTQAQTTAKAIEKELKTEKKAGRKEHHKLEGNQVSSRAKDHFLTDFPAITDVKWERGDQFDEANFTKDGQTTTAYYDYNSNLVGTTTNKKFTDLPANAQKEIKKQYKNYVPGAVVMYDDNETNSTTMYFMGNQFEGADHYFVTVSKGKQEIVLMVTTDGQVTYFKQVS